MINQGLSEKDLQDAVVSEALEVVEPEAVAVPSRAAGSRRGGAGRTGDQSG